MTNRDDNNVCLCNFIKPNNHKGKNDNKCRTFGGKRDYESLFSIYSPYVKQNDVSNSVMLELSPRLLNHAKEVADALNEKYHENGGKPNGYTNLFGVLESMLDIQLENETGQSLCVTDPLIPTAYSTQLPDASRR